MTYRLIDDLMNAVYPFQKSPRCSATSKRTKKGCQAPAVTGWCVCAGSTGHAEFGPRANETECIATGDIRMKRPRNSE
jgi:hypothetical protein